MTRDCFRMPQCVFPPKPGHSPRNLCTILQIRKSMCMQSACNPQSPFRFHQLARHNSFLLVQVANEDLALRSLVTFPSYPLSETVSLSSRLSHPGPF